MASLTHQRCFNHAGREAAARCPACQRFYCRECITEHEERVLCAACLRQRVAPPLTQRRGFVWTLRSLQALTGLFVACLFFYGLGRALVSIPASFHEGTLWRQTGLGE